MTHIAIFAAAIVIPPIAASAFLVFLLSKAGAATSAPATKAPAMLKLPEPPVTILQIIHAIADRANLLLRVRGLPELDHVKLCADIYLAHTSSRPLQLFAMFDAREDDFMRDVFAIIQNIDRTKCDMLPAFNPIFARSRAL